MILGIYLSRVLAFRIVAAAAVLLAFGLSLDLIRAADDLIAVGGGGALARYAALRAPAMSAHILPLAVLVGTVTGFLALGRRAELTVMRAAGQSVFRLLARLLPLALALGLLQHLLVANGIAWSERALAAAFAGIVESPTLEPGARVAGRIDGAVMLGHLARRDGSALSRLTVYALDADGQLTGRMDAAYARFDGDRWHLREVRRVGDTPGDAMPGIWRTTLLPATVRALASGEATASADEAAAALSGVAVATRSRAYYSTRLAQSRSAFAVPAVMLLCAAFASFTGPRGSTGLGLAVTGTVLGIGFVMLDGLFVSFGKVGLLPAGLAAWGPVALFATVAAWTLLMNEE